jgi:hypothetical protein
MNINPEEDEGADFTIESVGLKAANYNNIVDRYFVKYYLDKNTDKEQYVFIHTNGIVMCGLGKNNSILKSKHKIKEIKDLNKLSKVSGKRKHGAHVLMDNEYIVQFILHPTENEKYNMMSDGENTEIKFNFSPKVKGKLLELNDNLFKNHELIKEFPEKHGFICFLMLDHNNLQVLRERLEKMQN